MKKLLAGILAIGLAVVLSIPAFAANSATNDGTAGTGITVNGKFQAGAPEADVISVDLVWDDMSFTYTAPSKGIWNATEHKYEYATPGMWRATSGTDPKITVTNHSNVPVKAGFAFTPKITGMGGTFVGLETHDNALIIDSAEGTAYENAPSKQVEFFAGGTAIDADGELGTVTVTVASAITTVSTRSELFTARDAGGIIVLANDIDLGDMMLEIYNTKTAVILDLNGHTLTASTAPTVKVIEGTTLTVKNGSLTNTVDKVLDNIFGTVTVEDCTLTGGDNSYVIYNGGKMLLKDSVLNGIFAESYSIRVENYNAFEGKYAELTLSGNVKMDGSVQTVQYMDPVAPTVKALPGTYNFDVSGYVDTTLCDVTNDGTTWTVTAK